MKKAVIGIFIVIAIIGIIFEMWAITTYGNKPVSEIPTWIIWLLWK